MEKIKTAVIGCGKVGHFHAFAFQACENSELVACYGRNMEKTAKFAEQYGIRPYTDLKKMVEETGVQAVAICTPHPNHAELAEACCDLGLHIAVEKPQRNGTALWVRRSAREGSTARPCASRKRSKPGRSGNRSSVR